MLLRFERLLLRFERLLLRFERLLLRFERLLLRFERPCAINVAATIAAAAPVPIVAVVAIVFFFEFRPSSIATVPRLGRQRKKGQRNHGAVRHIM